MNVTCARVRVKLPDVVRLPATSVNDNNSFWILPIGPLKCKTIRRLSQMKVSDRSKHIFLKKRQVEQDFMNDRLGGVMEALYSQCSEREQECCELWCLSPCQGEQRGAEVFESAPNQTQADGWLSHDCGYPVSICSRLLWESYNYSVCGVTNFTLACSCLLCVCRLLYLERHCQHISTLFV